MWSCCWFWLFLVASANRLAQGQRPLTLAPTCRVKGHVKAELTVHCGDGVHAGVVRFWHTPFGDLRAPGLGSELDPVFLRLDGSLLVPNSSRLHSGLYYCLLQNEHGTTLWPYLLQVGQNQDQEEEEEEEEPGCGRIRIRRSSEEEEAEEAGVSEGDLASAVVASVLLTFVFGFGAGALSRTRVLRCLEKLPSLRQRRRPDEDSEIRVYEDVELEFGPAPGHVTMETASSPPVKPQRSFRVKREELQEPDAYLEGCDPKMEEEEKEREERVGKKERREGETGRGEEETRGEGEEEEQGLSSFYLGVDGGETDVDGENREEDEKKRGEEERQGEEEETEGKKEEEQEPSGFYLGVDGENREEERGSEQEGKEEEERDETEGERDNPQHEAEDRKEETSPPRRSRRSRVLRLYQYDEDGCRYSHLPDPPDPPAPELPGSAPSPPGSAPKPPGPSPLLPPGSVPGPKLRSRSLNRLSSIMAAASAGPLDKGGPQGGPEGGGPRGPQGQGPRGGPRFHMEI